MMDRSADAEVDPRAVRARVRALGPDLVAFAGRLSSLESPTDVPASQNSVQALLTETLTELGYRVQRYPGHTTGGFLYARPRRRKRGRPLQLLVGHTDTVWPLGTVAAMPVKQEEGRLYGPGTFDMKAGLALIVFALRVLRDAGVTPPATPVIILNSDEEIGSPESRRHIGRLARRVVRAFVPEPAMGPEGRLKTARKGVGRFDVHILGRPVHAGLNPGEGASAISELATVIGKLHALADLERGISVNVGVVAGGTRPNVVAAEAHAQVDVRAPTLEDGRRTEDAIRGLRAEIPGVTLRVEGGMGMPPLERTARNRNLFEVAVRAGAALGIDLAEAMVGGGSDGSVISQYTATLDGLGAVGDGAHAPREHIDMKATLDRCALLVLLLMAPLE